jgi:hypothetical protein
LAYRSINKFN